MTKAIAQTYNVVNENILKITYACLAACLFFVILYVANVFSVISKTVSLQSVQLQIATLNSNVNGLDSQYLSLSGVITPDNLSAYGMTQGKVTEYIPRSSASDIGYVSDLNHVAMSGHEF